MEWVLQVVDEVDDALGALRHGWLGLNAGFTATLAALLNIGRRAGGGLNQARRGNRLVS
jgi:hypothetical protein